MPSFSERNDFSRPREILFREDLPNELRVVISDILMRSMNPKFLLDRIERLFNPYGIDPLPSAPISVAISKTEDSPEGIASIRFIMNCKWFQIYDIIEDVYKYLYFFDGENRGIPDDEPTAFPFQQQLNDFFVHAGIGWRIVDGRVVARSSQASEVTQQRASEVLHENNMLTAEEHLHFATKALSARPESDTNGAISRATNAVECVLGAINGEHLTLGKHLDRYTSRFHPALKKALDGIYGFASDAGARHGKEGHKPTYEEADFVVSVCAAVCSYLASTEATSA
jgi:hypothetical protein